MHRVEMAVKAGRTKIPGPDAPTVDARLSTAVATSAVSTETRLSTGATPIGRIRRILSGLLGRNKVRSPRSAADHVGDMPTQPASGALV